MPGLTTPACTGPCDPGYQCPAGSANATAVACPAGKYSLGGAGSCTNCPAGVYGSMEGAVSSSCTGPCDPGYACPAGSANATAVACPAGQYSTGGAGSCTSCPAGTYGFTTGLTTASCSGTCLYACPTGSIYSTQTAVTTFNRISPGSWWSYKDDGSVLPSTWHALTYASDTWAMGPSEVRWSKGRGEGGGGRGALQSGFATLCGRAANTCAV
jgi:hypothetical protein